MMASYEIAVQKTLVHEGGFQNDPDDHANWTSGQIGVGILKGTKFGITAVDMPDADIENLTTEEAVAYYAEHYWKTLYAQIDSQLIANKLFDMGVLFGVGVAVRMIQATLNIDVDGDFGP